MVRITKTAAIRMIKKYNINTDVVPVEQVMTGMRVELEHGSKFGKDTNITHDGIESTFKIVLAHLHEDPQYYVFLKKMEEQRDRYWSKRRKPSIFNS